MPADRQRRADHEREHLGGRPLCFHRGPIRRMIRPSLRSVRNHVAAADIRNLADEEVMQLVGEGSAARVRAALRPPRRRRLLARLSHGRQPRHGRGRRPGGLPLDLAQPHALRPVARERAHLGARHRAQPRHRRAAPRRPARAPPRALEGVEERQEAPERTEVEVGPARGGAQRAQRARRLPADQRRTIELAYFGGFSHSQIAELLDEPIGTIKGRMRLGLDKLRRQLAEGFAAGEFA